MSPILPMVDESMRTRLTDLYQKHLEREKARERERAREGGRERERASNREIKLAVSPVQPMVD